MQPNYKFTAVARLLHWLIAAVVIFQVSLAYTMLDQTMGPEKIANYALHKSLGVTLFGLALARLIWRWWRPPPPLPLDMRPWERYFASMTHWLLYGLLFTMPLVGWLSSSAANFSVSYFKIFTLPDLVAPDHELHEQLELAHRWLAYLLFALVVVHVLAALQHHFLRKNNVLISMLPFIKLR